MSANALPVPRFVRRTQLGPNEYRKNFRQVDGDAITAVTSAAADRVTPLMSKIYLRLLNAPARCLEREGVVRFEGELSEKGRMTAWESLCELVGVASATARKALMWMHEQGIIGYYAGKNGVGIRIFLNRAESSIGTKPAGQKILEFPRASSRGRRTSAGEAAFSDSFADLEVPDQEIPRTPGGGAGRTVVGETAVNKNGAAVEEVVRRLGRELEESLQAAARQAAVREHERTREWLESKGLPKAARVAQREAYNVLRQHGVFSEKARASNAEEVGRGLPAEERGPLSDGEVEEFAGACLALLEVRGQPVELTLAQMSADSGGFLPPADALRVRARVETLLRARL